MTATGKVVQFILETQEKDVPSHVYTVVKRACLDNVGTMLAGSVQPIGHIVTEYVKETGGTPEATVVGTGLRTSATMAALANGTMGHGLDYDDVGGFTHSTTATLAALLATGETVNASGSDILSAVVLAW